MTPTDLGISLKSDRPGNYRTRCPACNRDGRDDALGVKLEPDGSFVAHCFRCGWKAGHKGEKAPGRPIDPKPVQTQQHETLAPQWREFWRECIPVKETLGGVYLQWRGCQKPPPEGHLRFHPRVWHWTEKKHLPALVALLTDAVDRTPRSLHFTFVDERGNAKAAIERPRLLLPKHRKQGAVCRLWPDEAITTGLAIGEGIETALAGAHAFGHAWAAIDAGNLERLPILPGIEALTIFADNDPAGLKAAYACAYRWQKAGREVRLARSGREGADLADEVLYVCG